jgi:serine/threonine protein phosphatase PrpC
MYLSPDGFVSPASVTKSPRSRISTLLEKGSALLNEDELLLGKRTYGVFDGATSLLPGTLKNGQTGGKLAADICKAAFANEERSLESSAMAANCEIHAASSRAGVNFLRKEELWSCSAAVVRMLGNHFDWCQIGDCQILVIKEDGSYTLLGKTPDQDIETLQLWKERANISHESIMKTMSREILEVRRRTNIDFGVFNGESEAINFLRSGSEPLAGVEDILLFSDGLLLPQSDPEALPAWQQFIELYKKGGLQELGTHVRKLQLEDIGCCRYPRFKTHDDISAVALNFEGR